MSATITEHSKIALPLVMWLSVMGTVGYFGISLGIKYSDILHEQQDLRKMVTMVIIEPNTLALKSSDVTQIKSDVSRDLWQRFINRMGNGKVRAICPTLTTRGLSSQPCPLHGFLTDTELREQ